MLAPWLLEFGRSREHRLEAQTYDQKCEAKLQIPLEVILYGLKWKSAFLEKWQGFDVKMHQNHQKSVKTSELEDRYAVIFSLALWPEEPREIDFFKKSWFSQKLSSKNQKNIKNELKWVLVARFELIFSPKRLQWIREAF